MMWLIAAILATVPLVTTSSRVEFNLIPLKPKVTFKTPNYPSFHNPKEDRTWVVSAPANVGFLDVECNVNIEKGTDCASAAFSFYYYDKLIKICRNEKLSFIIKGSTSTFTFQSSMTSNSAYNGVSCNVSYIPDEITTDMTKINPCCTCGEKIIQRIAGGTETIHNEYPWMAFFKNANSGHQIGGGSLIAREWVLTEAQNVKYRTPASIIVVLGEHNYKISNPKRKNYEVTQIIPHEMYGQKKAHDSNIALLKLAKPAVFNRAISPICLPFNYKNYDFNDKKGITTGWGTIEKDGFTGTSDFLKELDQKIMMYSKCLENSQWSTDLLIDNMICALGEDGVSYDDGSPLVWKSDSSDLYFQLGIVIGWTNDPPTEPTAYTKVSHFLDWIVEKTGAKDELCNKL